MSDKDYNMMEQPVVFPDGRFNRKFYAPSADLIFGAIMNGSQPIPNLKLFYRTILDLFDKDKDWQINVERLKQIAQSSEMKKLVDMTIKVAQYQLENDDDFTDWVGDLGLKMCALDETITDDYLSFLPNLDDVRDITDSKLQYRVLSYMDKRMSNPDYIEYAVQDVFEPYDFEIPAACSVAQTILEIKFMLLANINTSSKDKESIIKSVLELMKTKPFDKISGKSDSRKEDTGMDWTRALSECKQNIESYLHSVLKRDSERIKKDNRFYVSCCDIQILFMRAMNIGLGFKDDDFDIEMLTRIRDTMNSEYAAPKKKQKSNFIKGRTKIKESMRKTKRQTPELLTENDDR